ncbi:MAG: hypothetical protein GF411_13800 [Candidatus Lokiarchaeota archaeon]|nr:hypothetical protein [Candidatus Lokiarchaeota archaeon]
MPGKTEVIKIDVGIDIPSEIKKIDHISNTQKVCMAERIADGKVTLHKTDLKAMKENELMNKFGLLLEILIDKCINQDSYLTKEELMESSGDITPSTFMQKLNKFIRAQDGGIYNLKKVKRRGITCYKLVKMDDESIGK